LLFGKLTDDCHGSIIFKLVLIFINILMAGIIVASTISIILSGVQILSARDNSGQVAKAKTRIINTVIGLVAFALMYVILGFIIPGGVSLAAVMDDGVCPQLDPLPEPTNPPGSETPGSETPGGGENPGGDTLTYPDGYTEVTGGGSMTSNGGYKLVNTKQSVISYQQILKSHKVSQNSDECTWSGSCHKITDTSHKQYGHCDRFARAFGRDLIQDTTTSDDCIIFRYSGGWKTWTDSDKSKILAVIWNQLNNNRPVVIDVQYNSKPGQRHFATAVGYKASVSKFSEFKEEDIYILDTYNGFTTGGSSLSLRQSGGKWRADVATDSLMSGSGRKDCHY
jgi:hypothetical protein